MLRSYKSHQAAGPLDWQVNGEWLEIDPLPAFDAAAVKPNEWSLWRYAAMLPAERRISLGEGMTPLVQAEFDGSPVSLKLEYLNPTGSFKDRGTALLVNYLLAHNVKQVIEDSSGNAGASLAAYSAAAGIRCRIFVPASAPEGKKRLIASFGAELVEIPGSRAATTAACIDAAQQEVYASHAWSPYFSAGQMTMAWEIWEQMGLPDAVIAPVGQGSILLGMAQGFQSLLAAGLVSGLPRLYAAQAAGCDPIVRAWEQDSSEPVPVEQQPSVADGIAVTAPVRGATLLAALRQSKGGAIRVQDDEILSARKKLLQRGFMIEPTSAVPLAALEKLRNLLPEGAKIVIPLSGSGFKSIC